MSIAMLPPEHDRQRFDSQKWNAKNPVPRRAAGLDQPITLRTTSISFCGSKGLTNQPVAPAARPCAFMASEDSVVSIRIGVLAYCGMARRLLIRVRPSMRGMFWSVRTRLMLLVLAFS